MSRHRGIRRGQEAQVDTELSREASIPAARLIGLVVKRRRPAARQFQVEQLNSDVMRLRGTPLAPQRGEMGTWTRMMTRTKS